MKTTVLSILSLAVASFAFGQTDLILSEVVEGSGNSKGFEVCNPTGANINLSTYMIKRYNNGALTPSGGTLMLDNVDLAPGDVWVVINGQTNDSPNSPACSPALQALADQLGGDYPDPTYNNGNDAVTIEKLVGNEEVIVDLFGQIGFDPGTAWSDATGKWWTKDHTLIRKPEVTQGVTVNPPEFIVTLQWDSLPEDTWDSLGSHYLQYPAGIFPVQETVGEVYLYPNPSNGVFNVKASDVIDRVRVYNLAGQQVYINEQAWSGMQVELTELPKGLYFVEAQLGNGELVTRKISLH